MALDETIGILSTPGALEEIRQAELEVSRGEFVTAEEMGHLLEERRARERPSA